MADQRVRWLRQPAGDTPILALKARKIAATSARTGSAGCPPADDFTPPPGGAAFLKGASHGEVRCPFRESRWTGVALKPGGALNQAEPLSMVSRPTE